MAEPRFPIGTVIATLGSFAAVMGTVHALAHRETQVGGAIFVRKRGQYVPAHPDAAEIARGFEVGKTVVIDGAPYRWTGSAWVKEGEA